MFNFYVIPHKKLGRGAFRASTVCMSVLFLAASFFLAACTGEDTVEVPGPTVTTTVPGPTTTVEVPADLEGTDADDELGGTHVDDTIDGLAGDDVIEGGDGNDTLMGGAGDDEISGGKITEDTFTTNDENERVATAVTGCARGANDKGSDGDDIIHGGPGDDKLYGGSDDDMIYGEGGNDFVCGNSGDDMLDGGDGDDMLIGGEGDDTFVGGDGNDTVDYSSAGRAITVDLTKSGNIIRDGLFGRDSIVSGVETIKGSKYHDTLTGDDNANTFMPGAGADVLDGGAGVDTLDYSDATVSASNTAAAGVTINLAITPPCPPGTTDNPATETIITIGGSDNTAVNDTIRAPYTKDKDDATICLSSIENVTGGPGVNDLDGDSQDNVLTGGVEGDDLNGHGGNDTLNGGGGADTLNGGAGDDILNGGAGDDSTLNGGAGDDTLNGGAGNNSYAGGTGDDTYYIVDTDDISGSPAVVGISENTAEGTDTLSLAMFDPATKPANNAGFTLTVDDNIEEVVGSKYNDTITGNGTANDINGGAGNDTLNGGAGNDTLNGGAGNDTLVGNEGNDIFVIMSGEGNDTVGSGTDAVAATDKIQFKGFGSDATLSYRRTTGGGFIITIGNQSIEVLTTTNAFSTEDAFKKIVSVE